VVPIAFNAASAPATNASIVRDTVGSEAQPLTGTVSVGIVGRVPLLDLASEEDVKAEGQPFDRTELGTLLGQVPQPGRLGAAVGDGEAGQLGP
jgi:hypothetical protein